MGRKRRAGDRFAPSSYGEDIVHQRENRWDIPRKRALFGSDRPGSRTPVMDVVETQDYGPPGIGYPTVNQSGLFIENDSLETAWSPSQKLEDTVARLRRDVAVYLMELRFAGGQVPVNPPQLRGRSEFTSTPVPRYAGKSNWGQYQQVFAAIACSNGWLPTTAALQLFAHLDGEALNVALLMPVEERERWTVFVRGLSDYFHSPGRLAAVRRRFQRAGRRPGMDLATFATELGVLAMQGFDNMGERARGLMIRNKFIAAQPSRALRRHLDGASVEASIGDIVDSYRVWESHVEDGYYGPDLRFPHTITSIKNNRPTSPKSKFTQRIILYHVVIVSSCPTQRGSKSKGRIGPTDKTSSSDSESEHGDRTSRPTTGAQDTGAVSIDEHGNCATELASGRFGRGGGRSFFGAYCGVSGGMFFLWNVDP